MVATVGVFVDTGSGPSPTPTDTSIYNPNIRFKTADDGVVDTNNPIPIPTSGTRRSFVKWIYLKCTGGPFTQIGGVKFYTDGTTFGTGITVYIGSAGTTAGGTVTRTGASQASYIQATGTVGTDGTEMVALLTPTVTAKVDVVATHPVGTPKTIPISEVSSLILSSGQTTNYIVVQMDVASTASPGDLANRTWTFQYDEI